jgi:hypothetical protein
MYNLAFYTYFYGSNNNPSFLIPELPSLKYDCYFFTNNINIIQHLNNTKWIVIFDNKITNDDVIQSCMVAKHIKVCPHEYDELKKYDYLCSFDNKCKKVNENFVENYIECYFINNNFALLLREHWFLKPNIWNEYNESILQERYRLESNKYKSYIENNINNGFNEITEYHCACGFLIRNMRHPKTIELNNMWYQHIQECGIQDQISFFFVKQLFKQYIYPFTDIPYVD